MAQHHSQRGERRIATRTIRSNNLPQHNPLVGHPDLSIRTSKALGKHNLVSQAKVFQVLHRGNNRQGNYGKLRMALLPARTNRLHPQVHQYR